MWSIFVTRNIWALVTMVFVGMMVVAFVECQGHPAAHDQVQDAPAGHQRAPSPQTTLDLLCVIAALPLGVSLAPVFLVMPYALELLWYPHEFAFPLFIPPRHVLVAGGRKRRPGGSSITVRRRTSIWFRKFSQRRWLMLMTGMVLGLALVGCAGTVSQPPSVQPGRFTDSQPVAMTCSAETFRLFPGGTIGGMAGRYYCDKAKGPDGTEVPITSVDTRVGQKMSCKDTGGKITCPSIRMAMFERNTPWFQLNPSTFPPIVIPRERQWWAQ